MIEDQNAFLEFIQYVFGDWGVWFRFTITVMLIRRVAGDAIVKGSSAFWAWASGLFKRS